MGVGLLAPRWRDDLCLASAPYLPTLGMKFVSKKERSPWLMLLVGVLIGIILVPTAAYAGATLVRIVGNSGATADVSAARQLLTAPAAPAGLVHKHAQVSVVDFSPCQDIGAFSSTRATVLRQVNISAYQIGSAPPFNVIIFADANCAGARLMDFSADRVDNSAFSLDPGFPLAAGQHLSIYSLNGGSAAEVHLFGYLVPKEAVPTPSPSSSATTGKNPLPSSPP